MISPLNTISNNKKRIRRQIRELLNKTEQGIVKELSIQIQNRVMQTEQWRTSENICCYLSASTEVQTNQLLKSARINNKKVFTPAFDKQNKIYKLCPYNYGDDLINGYKNIPEPAGAVLQFPERIDIAIVPGIAFDRQGNRIGHGSGHFDRLLAKNCFAGAFKIGLCLESQLVNKISVSKHDIRMDAVATEKNLYTGKYNK
jgi:5-formyltetrahydrofolate cyclo-ligase